jgi:hypothetical protein
MFIKVKQLIKGLTFLARWLWWHFRALCDPEEHRKWGEMKGGDYFKMRLG